MNLLPRHQTALLRMAAERAQDETQKQVQPQKTQEKKHVQVIDDDGEKRDADSGDGEEQAMVIIEHEVESWRVGPRRRIWPRPVPGALTPACCVPGGSSALSVFSSICTVLTRAPHTARFVKEQWRCGRRRCGEGVGG